MLTAIGYWIQGVDHSTYPPPQELVCDYDPPIREAVARYLKNGIRIRAYGGWSSCRFYCGIESEKMGDSDCSDGVWMWPQGLYHYVENHSVRLPDEFIADAVSGRAPRGPLADVLKRHGYSRKSSIMELDALACNVDDRFWVEWSQTHRSGVLREKLAREWAELAQDDAAAFSYGVELERKYTGESDLPCFWKGCPNFALKGKSECAEHRVRRSVADMLPFEEDC